jgi:conjugative transfer region lipoprotein (TIGR03751 family)
MHAKNILKPTPVRWHNWINGKTRGPGRGLPLVMALWLPMTGCSLMGGQETILPQNGASMKDVYEGHFNQMGLASRTQRARLDLGNAGPVGGNLAGFTREADTEIQSLFPRLPNPSLVLYVFPHLTADRQPVPGYATSFPLYDKTEYALPGETEGREQ